MRRVTTKPKVTAGLKCPPEMWPTAETMTAITSPCARPTSVSVRAADSEPTPMKISAKVPTNSAEARFR